MSAIQIIADSTCDLSPEQIEHYHIQIVPLYVTINDKSYQDGIEIKAEDIFRHVADGGDLPKTAAIPVATYAQIFDLALKERDTVICLTIGAKFSSCYQNACIAADGNERVVVVDSANLSTGFGHVVLQAAQKAADGLSHTAIATYLRENIIPKVDASFIVDRLDYLHKGGRCSTIAALGANVLKLKPCIVVQDGEMHVTKKYRGNFTTCVTQYVNDRLSDADALQKALIFITHTRAEQSAVDAARAAICAHAHFDSIAETVAGCTISSHCGPNTLGVLFIRK